MAAQSSKLRHAGRGVGLGLAATLIALAFHRTDAVRLAELKVLDFQFNALPTISARSDIVHVELDDKALEEIGRWPWPRRRLAQLIDTLAHCGARSVMLDILLPHPQAPRFVKEGQTDLYTAEGTDVLNPQAPPVLVVDDIELGDVLARYRNLFLAMHVDIVRPPRPDPHQELVETLARMVTTRPAITRAAAAAELTPPLAQVEQAMATGKARGLERRIRACLREEPDLSRRRVCQKLFGRREPGSENEEILSRAYLRQRALAVIERFALPAGSFANLQMPAARAVPPLITFARVIRHTGFVTVEPDADGVVRRIPLLVKTDRGVFPQLALVLAGETLAQTHGGQYGLSAEERAVVISCPDGFTRRIPVDRRGYMLINWCRGRRRQHISAVAAQDVWRAREALQANTDRVRWRWIKMLDLIRRSEDRECFAEADAVWAKLADARWARHRALLFEPAAAPPEPVELAQRERQLDGKLRQLGKVMVEELDSFYLAGDPSPDEAPQITQLRALRAELRAFEAENAKLQRRLEEAKDRLRARIEGKLCLVGSSATGAADFVPTPLHKRTPGVTVHANILNTILADDFVAESGPLLSGLLVLGAGIFVAGITATRGAISAAALLATTAIGYAAVDTMVWRAWTYWMILVGPIGAMLVCFTVVTAYRQLTEQRHKRQITNTFKQYLSPAMVDRLVDDPTRANLGGERRQLSSLFSDLAGFTSLSERLGPERTVNLLNRYLDRVGEIVQLRHGGTLSKYEGDGVFAFFGAPIPQPDHAARAIAAAIDCQEFLPDFNRALQADGLLPAGARLSVRVGITTGEVLVGNMGSTRRIAYTAIGDAVNLAARLEAANKFFGTRILVNGPAWEAGRAAMLGRPLGKVLVVGKTEPVVVWEPLAADGQADEDLRRLAEDFSGGVERYAAGDFHEARERFCAIIARTDDEPARVYLRFCEQAIDSPPDPIDFDGVIRLAEK